MCDRRIDRDWHLNTFRKKNYKGCVSQQTDRKNNIVEVPYGKPRELISILFSNVQQQKILTPNG